jgi:hypothetical protein
MPHSSTQLTFRLHAKVRSAIISSSVCFIGKCYPYVILQFQNHCELYPTNQPTRNSWFPADTRTLHSWNRIRCSDKLCCRQGRMAKWSLTVSLLNRWRREWVARVSCSVLTKSIHGPSMRDCPIIFRKEPQDTEIWDPLPNEDKTNVLSSDNMYNERKSVFQLRSRPAIVPVTSHGVISARPCLSEEMQTILTRESRNDLKKKTNNM